MTDKNSKPHATHATRVKGNPSLNNLRQQLARAHARRDRACEQAADISRHMFIRIRVLMNNRIDDIIADMRVDPATGRELRCAMQQYVSVTLRRAANTGSAGDAVDRMSSMYDTLDAIAANYKR